ncbi:hypothetical protein [Actinoplanes cyaneus]|uniref:hypothetical protein n=1 Tax=Actinoplanes cyaneus TaxID=52696 RepID=UPI001942322A|nr:hypothetical protein [Actinoplanes cyaneus]
MLSTSGTTREEPAATKDTTAGKSPAAGPQTTTGGEKGKRRRKELPETRPPGVPQDPWAAFADAAAEKPPGRIRRAFRAFGRGLIHEYSRAIYLSLIFAAALTWPTLRDPLHTLPQDLGDPSQQAWQISWLGHVLQTNPVKLWQANAYFPTPDALAYGDSLLGYAPAGLLGTGPEAAVLRYNMLFVLAHALLLFGAYALVRQLGARPTGAAVAAAAFACAPWRLAQEGHLNIVSAGAIPLALALLARGHGWSIRYGFRPARRNSGWAALGWLVAIWQLTLGFALGVPFAYLLGAIVLVLLIVVPIRRFRQFWRARRLKATQNPGKQSSDKQTPEKQNPDKQGSDKQSPEAQSLAVQSPEQQSKPVTTEPPKPGTAEQSKPGTAAPFKPGTTVADKPGPAESEKADVDKSAKDDKAPKDRTEDEPDKAAGSTTTPAKTKSEQSAHALGNTKQVLNKADRIEKAEPGKPEEKKAEPGKPGKKEEPSGDKLTGAAPTPKAPGKDEPGTEKDPQGKKPEEKPEKKDAGTGSAGKTAPRGKRRPESRPERKRKPPRPTRAVLGWRLLLADYLGVLFFTAVGAVLAIPYLRVPDLSTRGEQIKDLSAPLRGLLIGPAESRIWGAAHVTPRASLGWAAEMSLLPGFMLYALALAGLIFSIWRWRQRLFLLLGLAVAVILTLGTTFFGGRWTYLPLFGHFGAAFNQVVPGRLMLWVTLVLAILAAGAVDEFVRRTEHLAAQRTPARPGPLLRLATLLPLFLVLLEGWNATAHPVTPRQPEALRSVGGPMLVLPTDALRDQTVQLWTTSGYQQVANGGGNVAVAQQTEMRRQVQSFPDLASIAYLRSIGVGTVVLIRSEVAGTPWEQAGDVPVDALTIRREDLADAVVFRLN